jgi:hypothetical protein
MDIGATISETARLAILTCTTDRPMCFFRDVLQDPEVLSPSTESLLRGPTRKRSFGACHTPWQPAPYPNGDSVSCVHYDNREPGPIPVRQCRFRPKALRYPIIARVTRDRRMPVAVRHHAGDWQSESATATDLVTGTASVHNPRTLAATSDPDMWCTRPKGGHLSWEALSATVTPSRTRLACDSAWL